MKRNKSRKVVPIVYKRSVYYFPLIMCIKEKIAIGVSKTPVKLKYSTGNMVKSKDKVILQHWKSDVAEFREGYFIDFTSKKNNTKIFCPKCGSYVDFRLFPSSTIPELGDVHKEDII